MRVVNRFVANVALATALATGAAFMASAANAATILNTIDSSYQGAVGYTVSNSGGIGESIALPFLSASAATITDITAFIGSAGGSVTLGIMADASGLPSGTFLNSQTVALSTATPVVLSSLSWSIVDATTYWLAAIATDGTLGGWNVSTFVGPFAVTSSAGSVNAWQSISDNLAQASIDATLVVSTTPLPAALPLFLSGLGALGVIGRRRKRKNAAALTG